ncbi:MAG: HIT family protein [Deltaproteobacteria bacterium]|nr:HIT family protein [Deltaproteobacteria bacterium]
MFTLHQRLEGDTVEVADLRVSVVRLMRDRTLPWLILVPKREGVREVYDLSKDDRAVLMEEMTLASRVIDALYGPDKINIGALGNRVPQLHVHVIGRFETDRAWPGPVWGKDGSEPYTEDELCKAVHELKEAFKRISSGA